MVGRAGSGWDIRGAALAVVLVLGALLVVLSAAPAKAGAYIYWVEGDSVSRADLDGSNVSTGGVTESAWGATGLAVSRDHVYWAMSNEMLIGRRGVDGTGLVGNYTGGWPAWGLAVSRSHLYWTVPVSGAIGRMAFDKTEQAFPFLMVDAGVNSIEVADDYLYWTNTETGTVGRSNLDGSGTGSSLVSGIDSPRGVVVDSEYVYWSSFGSKSIGRAKLDGTEVNKLFITGSSAIIGLAIDESHLYWTNAMSNSIGRAKIDGTGVNHAFILTGETPMAVAVSPDTTPPTLTIDSGPEGRIADSSPRFEFTAEAGSVVSCSFDKQDAVYGPCSSGSFHSPGDPLADGDYTFRVRAVDDEENESVRTRSFTVDTTAPETTIDSGPNGTVKTKQGTFTFSSPDATATFECRLDGSDWEPCASPKAYTGLTDGPHAFQVRATDEVGNTHPSPASRSFVVDTTAVTPPDEEGPPNENKPPDVNRPPNENKPPDANRPPVDTTAPTVKIVSKPKAWVRTKSRTVKVKVRFRTEAGAVITCRVNKGRFKPCTSPLTLKAKAGHGKGRSHTIEIRATDQAGNQGKPTKVKFRVIRKR